MTLHLDEDVAASMKQQVVAPAPAIVGYPPRQQAQHLWAPQIAGGGVPNVYVSKSATPAVYTSALELSKASS